MITIGLIALAVVAFCAGWATHGLIQERRGEELAMEIERGRARRDGTDRPRRERLIRDMAVGEEAWTLPWAMSETSAGLFLNSDYPAFDRPGGTVQAHIHRDPDGIRATVRDGSGYPEMRDVLIPDSRMIRGWPRGAEAP